MRAFLQFLVNLIRTAVKKFLPAFVQRLAELASQLTGTKFQVLMLHCD